MRIFARYLITISFCLSIRTALILRVAFCATSDSCLLRLTITLADLFRAQVTFYYSAPGSYNLAVGLSIRSLFPLFCVGGIITASGQKNQGALIYFMPLDE